MSAMNMRAYWPLIKKLLLPLGIIKFLLMLAAIVFICILVAIWFNEGLEAAANAVLPMLLVALMFYFLILGMTLPHQAMTMISSKSLRYLVDFRKFYFVSVFVFGLLLVLITLISVHYKQQGMKWYDLYFRGLQVWAVISVYVMALFFVTYRFPALQGFTFATFFAVPYMLTELSSWHHLQLIGSLAAGWSAFAFWWLKLKPQKKHLNIFEQSMEQMIAANAGNPSTNWIINFLAPSSKSRSFLGARLLGSPDNIEAIIRSWFFIAFGTLAIFVFFKWIMKENFENFIKPMGVYFVVIMSVSSSSAIMVAVCRNIKPLWLYFPGSRDQMFRLIEKKSFSYSGGVMLVMPILVFVANAIAGFAFIGLSMFVWMAVSAVLMNALTFYLAMSIYSRDDDSKTAASPLHGVVVFSVALSLLLFNFLISRGDQLVVIIVLFLVLGSILFVRPWLIKKWQTINFVRVG